MRIFCVRTSGRFSVFREIGPLGLSPRPVISPWCRNGYAGWNFCLRPPLTSHILCLSPHFQVGHFAQLATAPDRFSAPAARRYPWWQVAVLVALVAWLYSSILYHLVGQW